MSRFRSCVCWVMLLADTAAWGQSPAADLRGIYVYANSLAQITAGEAQAIPASFRVPGVDGVDVVLGWSDIEPAKGQYQWATLDTWVGLAAADGKKIGLVIPAGNRTPSWLFDPAPAGGGAKPLNFTDSNLAKGNGVCKSETIAAPWDPAFLTQWDDMLAALAAHLKSTGTYSAVTLLRLTGINQATEELRLPVETAQSTGLACVADSIAIWQQAGYRPSLLLQGWGGILGSFQKSFPEKSFSIALIPFVAFPGIAEDGSQIKGTAPDRNQPLLQLAAQKFPGRLVIQFDSLLPGQPPEPEVAQAAQTFGTLVAYQTNENLGGTGQGAACSPAPNPTPCTNATYLQMLESGIYPLGKSNPLRAQYIEVFHGNVNAFPDAVLAAHQELTPPPTLTAGSLANGATYVSGGLAPGAWAQVKGAGLSNVTRIWNDADFAGLGNKLPTNLSGVQVNVNNLPAAVYFIDPGQVSFQVPTGITGTASVQVLNNGVASNTLTATAATNSPGIFPVIVNGMNYAAAVFPDGKLAGDPAVSSAFRKAKAGDALALYATGLVPTPAGVLPTAQSVSGVTVTIGNVTVPADFAGLVAVGEFQINFKVPPQFATLAEGSYSISITVNGVSSPVTINSSPPGQLVIPIQH